MCKIIEIQSLTFIKLCNIISAKDFCKMLFVFLRKGNMAKVFLLEDLNG